MPGANVTQQPGSSPGAHGDSRLIMVRHALTVQDPDRPAELWRLADDARQSCLDLAEQLRLLRPERIVTSTHGKAVGTGRFLAEALDLPCETAPGLEEHERTGVGYLANLEFEATIERLFAGPDDLVLGTETANQALERFEASVRRQVESAPEEQLVLVSHATVMALFVARHNGFGGYAFWKTIGMPEALVLELPTFRLAQRLGPG
jgi:broad specificity phosphatase PhoE